MVRDGSFSLFQIVPLLYFLYCPNKIIGDGILFMEGCVPYDGGGGLPRRKSHGAGRFQENMNMRAQDKSNRGFSGGELMNHP